VVNIQKAIRPILQGGITFLERHRRAEEKRR
jgi:hypothetical protein